jgi:FkbM family methyltransferase
MLWGYDGALQSCSDSNLTTDHKSTIIHRMSAASEVRLMAMHFSKSSAYCHEKESSTMDVRPDLAIKSMKAALIRRLIGPRVQALVVQSESGPFAIDPEDEYGVGRKLRKNGRYGVKEVDRLRPLLTPESCVLFVGAHVGTLAIPTAYLCRDVIAVEANPSSHALLEMNVLLNKCTNCRTENVAAGDEDGWIEFLVNRVNSGGSKRVPKARQYRYYYDNPKTIRVPSARLDRLFEGQDIDVVVMDIEGSEYHALKGMQTILSRCRALVVEFVPHHLKYVAGITVEQFLSVITPHFSTMTIPSKGVTVEASEFERNLTVMYEQDEEDGDILFQK